MTVHVPSADAVRPSPAEAVRRLLRAARDEATPQEMEAAFAWLTEARTAARLARDWRAHADTVRAESVRCREALRALGDADTPQDTVRYGRYAVEAVLRGELDRLLAGSRGTAERCEEIRAAVVEDPEDPARTRGRGTPSAVALPLGDLLTGLAAARDHLHRCLAEYRAAMAELDAEERSRRRYLAGAGSVSLEEIRALGHRRFEELVASLLRRDGYAVERGHGGSGDLGADVIAAGPGGERIVVQCKLRREPGARIGSATCRRSTGRRGRTTTPPTRCW
ncbi:restriction endonuclease [Streptomyces sp. DH12]|uniref:restriction endonuclease n=1 Tax=Streptomyces sp. DH12 TaxID=2857010 RepID=UPI0027E20193|nr:restriction endonuclease [Streptomyces sp. DH12]